MVGGGDPLPTLPEKRASVAQLEEEGAEAPHVQRLGGNQDNYRTVFRPPCDFRRIVGRRATLLVPPTRDPEPHGRVKVAQDHAAVLEQQDVARLEVEVEKADGVQRLDLLHLQ